jgi:hypothetical protein
MKRQAFKAFTVANKRPRRKRPTLSLVVSNRRWKQQHDRGHLHRRLG